VRIAMVSEHASPLAALGGVDAGGQNVHVAALAAALARRGAEVVVHTRRDDPELPHRVQLAPGVTVEHVDAGPAEQVGKDGLLPYMDAFAEQLGDAWSDEPPDVVHSHFWMSGKAALAATRGVPVVHTFHALGVVKARHQGGKDTSPPSRIGEEAEIMRRCNRVVATCTDEVFELLRQGADRRRVSVIPCGVDLSLFHPHGRREPRPDGTSRIVVVGRLVERKGVGNAISALVHLPGTELVIAGGQAAADLESDQEARRLGRLVDSLGLAGRVDMRGRVERHALPALLRSADAVVCVPWYEPFGIVPLEAMACGVPVVASAVGGMIDTVVDGVTGVHVPPRSPDRVAGALSALLADPVRRRSLGRAGAERARSRYSSDLIAGATLDVYASLVRRRARRRRRVLA
jgi:D-inositol-3-phosphate glycosyltransferase